jgi:hypothetical protein
MSAFDGEALEVLRSIRDEVRSTNVRLDQTREELSVRLDKLSTRLDQTREELSAGIAITNERLGHVEGRSKSSRRSGPSSSAASARSRAAIVASIARSTTCAIA